MENIDSTPIKFPPAKKALENKKSKPSANSFKRLYKKMIMESNIKRQKEAENKKRYRLSVIIQKLLAGIILTSDELQFLKENAPVYYTQAMRQQRNRMTKNSGHYGIGKISETEPVDII